MKLFPFSLPLVLACTVIAAVLIVLKNCFCPALRACRLRPRSMLLMAGPILFGIGLMIYMAKTTSSGGNDAVLAGFFMLWSGWCVFLFAKELDAVREEQMNARFAWMKHSLDAHTAFMHEELHRYENIRAALDQNEIRQAREILETASGELTGLFHELAVHSLPLRLALLEQKPALDEKRMKVAVTILSPDLPGLSLPQQLDLYLDILQFVCRHATDDGIVSIRQETVNSQVVLTVRFSLCSRSSLDPSRTIRIQGHRARFMQTGEKGILALRF